MYTPKA